LSLRSAVTLFAFNLAALLGGAALIWLMSQPETLFGALGKDTTLTGRTGLWDAVIEMIARRPWLGYGFSGFWLGLGGESAHVVQAVNWIPPHAHNGLLDVWLDIGLLGVAVFLLGFLIGFCRAFAWARTIKTAEGMWPLTYLTFMVLFNLTENTILRQGSIFWILYVSTLLAKPDESREPNAARPTPARSERQCAGSSPVFARRRSCA
ncbi:MAG: O-antigen ligase family protein, partial [Verrucomicrobiae bacterium]|nr:O-antigen ligase family protein [Verrucomicrobiae bacterium]